MNTLWNFKINEACKHYQIFWYNMIDNLHKNMEARKTIKGISKELSTFLLWGKGNIIGYKIECYVGWYQVAEICCKICAKHKHQLLTDLKGVAVNSDKAFTEGVINIAKHQVLAVLFLFLPCWVFSIFQMFNERYGFV